MKIENGRLNLNRRLFDYSSGYVAVPKSLRTEDERIRDVCFGSYSQMVDQVVECLGELPNNLAKWLRRMNQE